MTSFYMHRTGRDQIGYHPGEGDGLIAGKERSEKRSGNRRVRPDETEKTVPVFQRADETKKTVPLFHSRG